MLRDVGLAGEYAAIARASPWLARELLRESFAKSYYDYSPEERRQKKMEDARALLDKPIVPELRQDPGLAEFVENVARLRGKRPSLDAAGAVKELREYPAAIPLLELCRELEMRVYPLPDYKKILGNHAILEEIFRPEFQKFARQIRNGLGYLIRMDDFSECEFYSTSDDLRAPAGGQIIGLFHNSAWREGMASGRAAEVIKKFGNFDIRHAPFYTELLKLPNSLEVLNQMEQKLQLDFNGVINRSILHLDIHHFRQLCENENLQSELFDERTVAWYQRLKKDFGYVFNFSDMGGLSSTSQDARLADLLDDPENRDLIKEAFKDPYTLLGIVRIKEVDAGKKPLIRTLAKEFHLRYGNYDVDEKFYALQEAQEAILPVARKLSELKIDFNILRDVRHLKKAAEYSMLNLFDRMKDQKDLCSVILHNVSTLIHDESDVGFIAAIVGAHGKAADALIRDYTRCLEVGAITTANKEDVLEFIGNFRILSPAIITEYLKAKQSGTREVFLTHLKSVAEKLTGAGRITSEEKNRAYFQDLLREVYPNNSGQWTNYENNESCEDRSSDIAAFRIRPRYEIDLLSANEIIVKEGETLDREGIELLKNEILSVAEKMRSLGYDSERAKQTMEENLSAAFQRVAEAGWMGGIDLARVFSPEEKLFLVMADAAYGTRTIPPEELRSLLIFYEFAQFEDIRDYIQGTSERVSRAGNQEYALLCEFNTFFFDRIKEVNRRLVETGFSSEAIRTAMPEYFRKLSRETLRREQETAKNRMQIEKLGLNDDFIRQLARTLRGKTGKSYTPEQISRLVPRYESLAGGLQERASTSSKQRTRAFYGQLKSQRDRTLQAIRTLTGRELSPADIHLGELDIQQLLDAEVNIREGVYEEEQFASYTVQRFLNFFVEQQALIERELDKFQSEAGNRREALLGYISKSKESAHARMVGGVCVSGDNPQKAGRECMWNMQNYFQLVLQDPDTYRCVGLALLHHFTDERGQRILTASLNPSSTYLYGVDEKAMYQGLMNALETFAKENNFDMILFSKQKQIRTNRTGGVFEREMDSRIQAVGQEYRFSEPQRFSYSPKYFMQDMDVVWRRSR